MESNAKKHRGGLLFLLIVILLYGIALLLDETLAQKALGFAVNLLYRVTPVLLLVFLLIFLSNLLLRPELVRAHLGKGSGARGWVIAMTGGILSVGPVYPWYALLGDLQKKGMRNALITVFLYSRAIKLPLLPLMIHYFGMTYTLVFVIFLALFAILNGVAMERLYGKGDSRP
jgi:uncharacterized membrane protein YraQ (UPF0718 family)